MRKHIIAATIAVLATSCSLHHVVESNAIDYRDVMESFSNQAIVTNILRARDNAPLHYADFSRVTGSTSAQLTIEPNFYIGPHSSEILRDATGGNVQFTTSPSFDIAPLDTEAFTVGVLQPINPLYFATYWENGSIDRRLLAYLFIDSIRYNPDWLGPGGPPDPATCSVRPLPDNCRATKWLKNDPTSESFCLFEKFVSQIAEANDTGEPNKPLRVPPGCATQNAVDQPDQARLLRFKSFTVLVPYGREFVLGTASGKGADKPPSLQLTDLSSFHDDPTIHVGIKHAGPPPIYQLYHRQDAQLGLCYGRVAPTAMETTATTVNLPAPAAAPRPAGALPAAVRGQGGGGGAASSLALSAPTLSLIGNVLDPATCRQSELVARQDLSEDEVARDSGNYLEIRLRSVAGIIRYLGQVQRVVENRDKGIDNIYVNDRDLFFRLWAEPAKSGQKPPRLRVKYRGDTYDVGADASDHTLQVLAILSEMINTNKVSGDIPTTKQVQIIP